MKKEATKKTETVKDPMILADNLSAKLADQYRSEVETGQKTVEEFLAEIKSELETTLQNSFGDGDAEEQEKKIYQFYGKFVINILIEFDLI